MIYRNCIADLIPATTVANNNNHSDEQHCYTVTTTDSRHQQHFIHNDYTPSSNCKF